MAERNGPDHYPGEYDAAPDHAEVEDQDDRTSTDDEQQDVPEEPGTTAKDAGITEETSEASDESAERDSHASDAADATVVAFPSRERAHSSGDSLGLADEGGFGDEASSSADDDIVELDELADEAIDLSALQADDALLDALGGTDPDVSSPVGGGGPGLEELLVAWRREVDAAPIGELVDTDEALEAIASGRRGARGAKRWYLVPVATAAAVLMIAFTGVGVAARDALPGDMLWGVAEVFYNDHTRAVNAASAANGSLNDASTAWDKGDYDSAESALNQAQRHMREVDAEHGLAGLQSAHASLSAKLDDSQNPPETSTSKTTSQVEHPTPTVPPSSPPPPSLPLLPPPPPSNTSTSIPSTSGQPTQPPTTGPSTTSDSSERPSSGTSWGGSSDSGFFRPPTR